jgi:hypothetical protein
VKKPGGGSAGGPFPTGPELTPKQKAERDRAEASNARIEAQDARTAASVAAEEAAADERRAAADRKRHEYKYARQEMREARADLARERRDLARAARDQARARRDMGRARTAGLARPGSGGAWVLGGNDEYLTCAAAAVANSLLLATGQRLSDEDVLALHVAAAGHPDAPASVLGVLGAAGLEASPVHHRRAPRLPGRYRASTDATSGGTLPLILELALPGGTHAVALADGFAVTWGRAVPVTQGFLERHTVAAWQITWPLRSV